MAAIVLAHQPSFRIGPLIVRPATRTLVRDGAETIIEPRVMQVFVALAQANGSVVTRDELVDQCWDGRIVGDDAINRILSRLRQLEHNAADGVFRIETITRVGYRLIATGVAPPDIDPAIPSAPATHNTVGRRRLIAAGVAGTALAAGGGLWLELRRRSLPAAAREAMERGEIAIRDITPDQTAVAIAAFRRATELAPDAAEPWGQLALAYQQQLAASGAKDAADAEQLESRARTAAARALTIDPDNADAETALATLRPSYRRWFDADTACRRVLQRHPAHGTLNRLYGILLYDVGRGSASIDCFRRALAADSRWPQLHVRLLSSLWGSGQLDQADAEMERTFATWPRHYSVWFTRQRMLTYTGRAEAALAMLADLGGRPLGIPDWNFAMTEAETRAVGTRARADIDTASRLLFEAAHRAVGFAANAIVFHAVVGRIDDAFALIDAYYFDKGFTVGTNRYSGEQGMHDLRRQRSAYFLMMRGTEPLRTDPRFPPLLRAIGLEEYWRRTHTQPDYRARPIIS